MSWFTAMSARVRVRTDDHGRAVAVKVASGPLAAAALVREAAVLGAVRRPGVVALVGLARGADGLELLTAWVGTCSLAVATRRSPADAARVVARLAATVAGLHADGIVHGGIEASHVLLDARGRPVLCSFAGATLSAGAGAEVRPADDVAALGTLLVEVLGPPPEPRLDGPARPPRRADDELHRGLLVLADHARADDPDVRPTAAAFRAALLDLAPSARDTLTDTDDLDRLRATSCRAVPRHRDAPALVLRALAALVGVALIGAIGAAVVDATADRAASLDAPRPTPSPTVTTAGSIGVDDAALAAPTASATPSHGEVPIVDVEGVAYEVGLAGDVAAAAHWRCERATDVLLLRPATGELFLFADPPRSTTTPTALPFETVPGAVAIEPTEPDAPCPSPVVVLGDGTVRPVGVPVA